MAKFAIALCILLVACGAQAAVSSTLISPLSSGIQTLLENLSAASTDVSNAAETVIENVNSTIQAVISNLEERVAALEEQSEIASSCVSSSTDFTATAEEVASATIECVSDVVATWTSEYNNTVTALQELTVAVSDYSVAAEACSAQLLTSTFCLAKLSASSGTDLIVKFGTLTAEATVLISSVSNFQTTLAACGLSSAVLTLTSEAEKAYAEIVACIAASA